MQNFRNLAILLPAVRVREDKEDKSKKNNNNNNNNRGNYVGSAAGQRTHSAWTFT